MLATELEEGSLLLKRYEVCERVGSGSMGTVYRVIDKSLRDTPAAIKVLHPHLVNDPKIFSRFRNEVLLARSLRHENIVSMYDLGEFTEGMYFISMEYVPGHNLGHLLRQEKQRPSLLTTTRLIYQIASGVAYAHQMGIVHRDLKPDNVLLHSDGTAKINDFGLARTLRDNHSITLTGETVGTPHYMSPEQIEGHDIDGRSDIYSLGIIAYELATGVRPFDGPAYYEVAKKHLTAPIPTEPYEAAKLPIWFQDLITRSTAKNREKRFKSMDELLFKLQGKLLQLEKRAKSKGEETSTLVATPNGLPLKTMDSKDGNSGHSAVPSVNNSRANYSALSQLLNYASNTDILSRPLIVAPLALLVLILVFIISLQSAQEVRNKSEVAMSAKLAISEDLEQVWEGEKLKSLHFKLRNISNKAATGVAYSLTYANGEQQWIPGPGKIPERTERNTSIEVNEIRPKGPITVTPHCANCERN